MTEELLTVPEAGHRLGLSYSTSYKWLHRGDWPGAVQTPGGWRIPLSTVESILERRIADAELALSIEEVFAEHRAAFLDDLRHRLGIDVVPADVLARIADSILTVGVDAA